jgi:putative ABC transport system permease protein
MFIAAVASKEAVARSKYTYKRQFVDSFISILSGVGLTLLHLIAFVLGRRSLVKINAQTVIPIAGMLFGNALTAASLTKNILLQNYLEDFDRVELRLSRGASFWEACLPVIRDAVEAALAPTINAMAATGIIFLPGMMTGQILGGQSPQAASGYQVMIYFAIGASSCLTAILMSLIVTSGIYGIKDSIERASDRQRQPPVIERSLRLHSNSATAIESRGTDTILEVKNLTLPSTNLTIPSFIIGKHSRIGVVGRSGVGKTRFLRALSKLEDSENGEIYLNGLHSDSISISKWRSRVMWVSQGRPTLSGTPMDLYESILGYKMYRKQQKIGRLNPIEIASSWNLPEKAWYQPWSSLSGGEAQRANLAIALALQPDVLLLDEPTSNCDTATTISIEKTLRELNLTAVIVSHSEEQIKRICTSRIELQETLMSG